MGEIGGKNLQKLENNLKQPKRFQDMPAFQLKNFEFFVIGKTIAFQSSVWRSTH